MSDESAIQPSALIASAEEIDNRLGPVAGRSSDRIARELRQAGAEIERLRRALATAIGHIDHMGAWIAKQNAGYSFESLGEDMQAIRAAGTES